MVDISIWSRGSDFTRVQLHSQNSSPRLNSPAAILMAESDTSINPLAQAEIFSQAPFLSSQSLS